MTTLPEGAVRAMEAAAATDVLLVALDFDGTLAPTVDDPEQARALPAAREAIEVLLTLPRTRVAVVSGRAIASLERVSQLPPEVLLVGSHGAEFRLDGRESGPELDDAERELLGRLYAALASVASRFPGVRIEEKPAGCGLHTRTAMPDDAAAARDLALRTVDELAPSGSGEPSRISARYGKDILEFTVRAADKGTALQALRAHVGSSATVFVGDDVTDEDGFRVLGPTDVGVKVGAGDTAAVFRVEDPAAAAALLGGLAGFRERHTAPGR
jgi:trehalose 6-phosphate phosphatase